MSTNALYRRRKWNPASRNSPRLPNPGEPVAGSQSPATEIFLQGDLESGLLEGRTDEASTVHGRADHRGSEGARGRGEDGRSGAQAWRLGSDALQLEGQVRRPGGV